MSKKKMPKGYLVGTVALRMKELGITTRSSDEAKAECAKVASKAIGRDIRTTRSKMNWLLKNSAVAKMAKIVQDEKPATRKRSAPKAATAETAAAA